MRRAWTNRWIAVLLVVLPTLAQAQAVAPSADVTKTVDAVWVERELSFTYMPITSHYSCDGLRDRVSWILKQLGARPGFRVTSRGCLKLQGPEAAPGVNIVAALPAPATPELLAQLAADASKRQLAARAAGKADPVDEATARFPARVRRVELNSSGSHTGLQDGDCELMEQLRDRVFGPLGAAVVADRTRCVPGAVRPGAVRMTVEVLEPVPTQ
jgi:hypothetical protein